MLKRGHEQLREVVSEDSRGSMIDGRRILTALVVPSVRALTRISPWLDGPAAKSRGASSSTEASALAVSKCRCTNGMAVMTGRADGFRSKEQWVRLSMEDG